MELAFEETKFDKRMNKSDKRMYESNISPEPQSPVLVESTRPALGMLQSPENSIKNKYSSSVIKLKECDKLATIPKSNSKQNKNIVISKSNLSSFVKKAHSRSVESTTDKNKEADQQSTSTQDNIAQKAE